MQSAPVERSISHTVSPRGTTRWSFIDAAPEAPPRPRVTLIVRMRRLNRCGTRRSRLQVNGRTSLFLRTHGLGSVHHERYGT